MNKQWNIFNLKSLNPDYLLKIFSALKPVDIIQKRIDLSSEESFRLFP